jgi:adhesin transport system outer membrane protein
VIDRFKRCVCCVLVLIMQFVLSPIATITAAEMQVGGVEPKSASSNDPGSTLLRVANSAGSEMVAPGDFVSYDLTVANTSRIEAASDIRILDMFPDGFRFKSGSVQLNGASCPDPAVSDDGKTLIFTVGTLAAEGSATIRFVTEITADSKLGKAAINYASAISSGGGNSNIAKATVLVRDDLLRTKGDLSETLPAAGDDATALQAAATAGQAATPSPGSSSLSTPPIAPVKEKPQADSRMTNGFVVPEKPNLAELIGMSEISVLADVDGQFVKNMSENQIIENESASQVGEANLLESIRAGRSFNRESLAALARTAQAKAQTGQALALLLPSVSVRASSGYENSQPSVIIDEAGNPVSSDTHARTDASLTARQPLFDLPSFQDWRRREVIELARGESYRVSDSDAYVSAVNAYLNLVSSRLQIDLTRDFETQLTELLTYIKKRASAGAASISDMARVRARSEATLSSRLEQESAHAAAGVEFVRLTNLVPRKVRLPLIDDVGASFLPKSFDMAVTTAMKSNPEIAALTAEVQAAEIDKLNAKGRFLPRVDAEYTDSYALHAGGDTSSSGQRDKRIMMVLNWTLFSGGSDYQNHVERTERHKELRYRLDDQRRRVVQTLSANYATLETTRERIASGYLELKSISTAAEAMSKRMLSGNQSLLDLLDVYDRFYQVRSRLVSLHILEMTTVTQLVRLMLGTPGAASEVKTEPAVKGKLTRTTAPLTKDAPVPL